MTEKDAKSTNASSSTVASVTSPAVQDPLHYDPNDPRLIKGRILTPSDLEDLLELKTLLSATTGLDAIRLITAGAHQETAVYKSLAAYREHQATVKKEATDTLTKLKTLLDEARCADAESPLKALPEWVFTGSIVHGVSYPPPDGDVDFAWVCSSNEEMKALQALFCKTFSAADDAKRGRQGTMFEGARFPVGTKFLTKKGLPWIPFYLHGSDVKYDQTFRLAADHTKIEDAAVVGHATRFGADDKARFEYIRNQHFLSKVKHTVETKRAAIAKELGEDAVSKLAQRLESIYVGNKVFLMLSTL